MDFIKSVLNTINKYSTLAPTNPTARESFKKEINICFGVDSIFIRPMGVTITSLAVNNPDVLLKIHVFLGAIPEEQLTKLEELTNQYNNIIITLYTVEQEKFNILPFNARFSPAVYFRLIMPRVLSEYEHILFIDADIVCLNKIDEIIDLDMGDKIMAAVLEEPGAERLQKLNLPLGSYFNAGVMKIDTKKWNEYDISKKALEIKQAQQLGTEDQDALNVALNGKIFYLPGKWNCILWEDIPDETVFLHYSGNLKPWRCTYDREIQSYYLKYEKMSPWRDMDMELPIVYPEARIYAKMLFGKGKIFEAVKWVIKLAKMRHETKKKRNSQLQTGCKT